MATALYPGAFKPPHRGHFEVVKKLLDGSHGGKLYSKDTVSQTATAALKGDKDEVEPIDKVVVFIGAKDRNGISTEESLAIWRIYAQYLGNVEFYYEAANPMQNASAYAKKRPEEKFYAVTGIRGEEDVVDLKRITSFKNRENVQGLAFSAPGGVRATDLRSKVLSGNLDDIRDFFPSELSREDLSTILEILKDSIIAELLAGNISGYLTEYFGLDSDTDTRVVETIGRNKLDNLYNYISRLTPTGTKVSLQEDSVVIKHTLPLAEEYTEEEERTNSALSQIIGSILEYMLDEGMNIQPLPEVKIRYDEENAQDFFGRSAYYDPSNKEIILYATDRHPKDICRSFAHEMIHHIQNIENRIGDIRTQNTNEDDRLLELEKEAYLRGNITFRNWEDKTKNQK